MKILVNIDVPELGPAIDFYRAALGLNVNRVIDEDVAELTGASSVLYLLRKAAGSIPVKDLASGANTRDIGRLFTLISW